MITMTQMTTKLLFYVYNKYIKMNNPETYLLSHNRFIDYLVLIFVDKKGLRFTHFLIE